MAPSVFSLQKQRAFAWAKYYAAEERAHESDLAVYRTVSRPELVGIPACVQNEFREMVATLKKNIECPVCFDVMEAKDIKFTNCGHKFCEACLSRLEKCALCRKTIFNKKRKRGVNA